jgi:hypothetical protein
VVERVWRRLPRCTFSQVDKVDFTMGMLARLVVSPLMVAAELPGVELAGVANLTGGLPPEAVAHIRAELEPKVLKLFPGRYSDDPAIGAATPLPPGYGGRLPPPQARL